MLTMLGAVTALCLGVGSLLAQIDVAVPVVRRLAMTASAVPAARRPAMTAATPVIRRLATAV